MNLLRRHSLIAALALASVTLGGCALINTYHAEVASWGTWQEGRKPGSYRFERLPSQAQQAEAQKELEEAAASALQKAGFVPAAEGQKPDYVVSVGAKVAKQLRSPWDDPLWARWQAGVGRGYFRAPWGWPTRWDTVEYEREAAVLIRDAQSNEALYEARARSNGATPGSQSIVQSLFHASLAEFPAIRPEPHNVAVTLP